ncbi:hypothetical protein FQR65_LT08191 [Abscondita terminalis]|nr:hypothetical protein FQR65_LT08191 [Abscondita terminalis]
MEGLLNSLKSDDPIVIDRILKVGPTFIRDAFKNMSGSDLVNNLFPQISYNAKLKLLHKFALYLNDVDKADEYFKAVEKKYGVYLAVKMLPSCSEEIIINCIKRNRVEIVPKHMLKILERHPLIAEDVLSLLDLHNNKLRISDKYDWVFKNLAKTNVELCAKLWDKHKPTFVIGVRATRTLIKNNKKTFMANPRRYVNYVNKSKIGKVLKQDFDDFFLKVFPTTISKFNDTVNSLLLLLKHVKVNSSKLSALEATFRKVHQREIWDFPVLILPQLLKLMEPEQLNDFVESRVRPEHISEDQWITYMKCEKSIPFLKDKIDNLKLYSSYKVCEYLAETCAVNRDFEALVDVLLFVKQKTIGIQSDFLRRLLKEIDFSVLEEKHWNLLNEFVELYKTTGNLPIASSYIFGRYIRYRFHSNLPTEKLLISWADSKHVYNKYKIEVNDYECEKSCLEIFAKMDPSFFPGNKFVDYLVEVSSWNRRFPNDKIKLNLNEEAWKLITMEQYCYSMNVVVQQWICDHFDEAVKYQILKTFFEYSYNKLDLFVWLLKHHPRLIHDHVDDITTNLFKIGMVPLYIKKMFKYCIHKELITAMKNVCLGNFHNCEGAKMWLSVIVDVEEFKRLCCENEYKELIEHLKYATCSSSTESLDLIKKFCMYEHLQYVQRPLYLVSYNLSENKLAPFLLSLKDRDLHMKKHITFLAFKFLSKEALVSMFAEFLRKQDHVACKYVFKGVFNLFIRSPDDNLWEITQNTLEYLDKNDVEVYFILSSCRRIPNNYFVRYVMFTWLALQNVESNNETTFAKTRILQSLTMEKITSLPEDFCFDIIRKYLFKCDLSGSTYVFTCRFIINKPMYVKRVFSIVEDEVRSAHLYQKKTIKFIDEFCNNFLNNAVLPREVFEEFVCLWDAAFKPHECYYEYLRLHFTLIYLHTIGGTLEKLGEELTCVCNSFDDGLFEVDIFVKNFSFFKKRFYNLFPDIEFELCNVMLIENILKNSFSDSCVLFAISLLPEYLSEGEIKYKYESILDSLKEKLSPVAQVYFYRHLSGTEMDKSTEEFINNFHALTGVTIGERKKNLHELMNNTHSSINTRFLTANNLFEENLKIEVLCRFNKFPELFDILKEGNRRSIKKILRNTEFFDHMFVKNNPNELIELFSQLSFSTKLKIANRLGKRLKNPKEADEHFEVILNNYGLNFVSKLLPFCSLDLVLRCIPKYHVKLSSKGLLMLIKNYRSSTLEILEAIHFYEPEKSLSKIYGNAFKFFLNDWPLLLKLVKKYGTDFNFGSRTTYKILKTHGDSFFKNNTMLRQTLKEKKIVKAYPNLYYLLFPDSINEFECRCHTFIYYGYLNHIISKPKKLQMILDGFQKRYDSDFWDYRFLIRNSIIEMMNPESRLTWMKNNTLPDTSAGSIALCRVDESIPQLKKLLRSSSNIKMRVRLISALIKTCQLNDDQDALLDVLNYIRDNHRRDHKLVIEQVLASLRFGSDFSKLQERHWSVLNDLLEEIDGNYSYIENLRKEYLYFCMSRNDPIEHLIKEIIDDYGVKSFNRVNSKYEKICLKLILEVIYKNYTKQNLTCKLIDYLLLQKNWNKSHRQDQVPLIITPEIVDHLARTLNDTYAYSEIVYEYIVVYFSNSQKLLLPFLKSHYYDEARKIASWLLKHHPYVFLENLEPLIQFFVSTYKMPSYVLQVSPLYTHLGMPDKISDICVQNIGSKRNEAWTLFAAVAQHTHIPEELKAMTVFQRKSLRSIIVNDLWLQAEPLQIKKVLSIFCDEINENKILDIFQHLNQRDVSIRKHVLSFALNALNINSVESLLTKTENEHDQKIKKTALKGLFNLFIKNPQKKTWNLLQKWLKNKEIVDKRFIRILTKSWNITNDYLEKNTFTEERQSDLLSMVSKNVVGLLPNEFSETIIKNKFLCDFQLTNFQKLLIDFTIKYTLYKNHNFLTSLFETLQTFDGNGKNIRQSRPILFHFVKEFCSHFLDKNVRAPLLLKSFVNLWTQTFGLSQFYTELLYAHFAFVAIDCKTPEETGIRISELSQDFFDDNCFIHNEFIETYSLFRNHFLKNNSDENLPEETELRIIEKLANGSCLICHEFAICLLPKRKTLTRKCQLKRDSIVALIQQSKSLKIKAYVQFYCIQ